LRTAIRKIQKKLKQSPPETESSIREICRKKGTDLAPRAGKWSVSEDSQAADGKGARGSKARKKLIALTVIVSMTLSGKEVEALGEHGKRVMDRKKAMVHGRGREEGGSHQRIYYQPK